MSLLNARSSTPLQRRHCLREDTAYGKDCLLNIRKADERQKNLPAMQKTQVQSLGQEDPLENGVATHSSILAWEILWTEEPGRLQTTESQRVGHNRATQHSTQPAVVFLVFKYEFRGQGGEQEVSKMDIEFGHLLGRFWCRSAARQVCLMELDVLLRCPITGQGQYVPSPPSLGTVCGFSLS